MTQNDRIYNHLLSYGSITQKEAYQIYGCFRLASRISDLKRQGKAIKKVMEKGKNKFGETEWHARYYLHREGK